MPSTSTDRLYGMTTSVAVKPPCRVATTGPITASGEQTINSVAVVTGDRVLRKDEVDTTLNGIWVVDTSAWSRAPDFDGSLDAVNGTLVLVQSPNVEDAFYTLTATNPVIIGTSALVFTPLGVVADASEITYTPAGAGAVATTVQAKLRESVSVLDKDVDPTGGTDSTTGLLNANTDAATNEVAVPAGEYLFTGANLTNVDNFKLSKFSAFKNSIYSGIVQQDAGKTWLQHNHLEVGTGTITSGDIPPAPVFEGSKQRHTNVIAHWYNDFGLDAVRAAGGTLGSTQWYYWSWLFHGAAGDGYEAKRHPWLGYYRGDDVNVLDWQCYWLSEAGVTGVNLQPRQAPLSTMSSTWSSPADGNYWIYQLLNNAPNFKTLQYSLWVESGTGAYLDAANQTEIEATFDEVLSIYQTYKNVNCVEYQGGLYPIVFVFDVTKWRSAYDNFSGSANTIAMLKAQALKFIAAGFSGVCVLGRNNSTELVGLADLTTNNVLMYSASYVNTYDSALNGGVSPAVTYDDLAAGVAARHSASFAYEWSVPAVATDRDSHSYHPTTWAWGGSTPDKFGTMCLNALRRSREGVGPKMMTIYNVAEWGEGGACLQPNMRDGKGYLTALRQALNSTPNSVNPEVIVSSGTFTPLVSDATTGGNLGTPSTVYGTWTKVGTIVNVTVSLVNINTAGMTAGNAVHIQALPFAASNVAGSAVQRWFGITRTPDIAFTDNVVAELEEARDYVKLYDNVGSGADAYVIVSNLTSGAADIYFSITYTTAA